MEYKYHYGIQDDFIWHERSIYPFNHVFIVYFVIEHWASTAKLWYYTNYYGVHFKVLQYFLNKWMYRKILNVSRLAERIYAKQFWHSSRITGSVQFSSVQSLSRVRLFATPWITALQASLSITNSWSSLRLTAIESVMPSSHLILCRPLLLLPLIPPSIRVFSNESTLRMTWPKYWSFSFSIIRSVENTTLTCGFSWAAIWAPQFLPPNDFPNVTSLISPLHFDSGLHTSPSTDPAVSHLHIFLCLSVPSLRSLAGQPQAESASVSSGLPCNLVHNPYCCNTQRFVLQFLSGVVLGSVLGFLNYFFLYCNMIDVPYYVSFRWFDICIHYEVITISLVTICPHTKLLQ